MNKTGEKVNKKAGDTGKRRHPLELAENRAEVAGLYVRGLTQQEIAKRTGLSQATVCRDLIAIQKAWEKSASIDIGVVRSQQLAKLDKVEREYWEGFERSRKDQVRDTQKKLSETKGKGSGTSKAEMTRTVQKRDGSVVWLNGVLSVIKQRNDLLGLVTHSLKHDLTDLTKLSVFSVGGLDMDDI